MKFSSSFVKEIVLAFVIVLNGFLVLLHLPVTEELKPIEILGYKLVHGYPANQAFVWYVLGDIQVLVYAIILFYFCNRRYKYAILVLIYWQIYGLILDVFYGSTLGARIFCQILGMAFTFLLAFLLMLVKVRKIKNFGRNFSLPINRFDWTWTAVFVFLSFGDRIVSALFKELNELSFLGIEISSQGFPNLSSFFGYLIFKMQLLLTLLVLFFDMKKWWRYACLVPLLLTIYQIRTALDSTQEHLDTFEIAQALPFILIIMCLLVFLSKSAYYQSRLVQLYRDSQYQVEKAIKNKFKQRESLLTRTREQLEELKSGNTFREEELLSLKRNLEKELQSSNG